MWTNFCVNNEVYMLKIVNSDDAYKIHLSDLTDIWSRDYSKDEIIEKFKECNPIIVAEADEAVSQALKILNEINDATVIVDKSDEEIVLQIKSEALGISDTKFKLKYELNLSKERKGKFTEDLTAPMIHTISYLEKQQRTLCDLIKKKDRELEEYRMEKGLISRTDLITETFDPALVSTSSDKLLLNVFNESTKFWEGFVEKYGGVEAKVMDVKVEPWNQVKRKRKMYNAKTSSKKFVSGITYKNN